MDTFEKVRDIIAEKMDIDKTQILTDSSFESLKIDSLDMVEIVMDIEEAFNISIEKGEGLKTMKDLVEFVDSLKA